MRIITIHNSNNDFEKCLPNHPKTQKFHKSFPNQLLQTSCISNNRHAEKYRQLCEKDHLHDEAPKHFGNDE